MDKIRIVFDDGSEYKLSDKFDEFMWKEGASDMAFDKYKRENNMCDLTDFNSESTNEISLIIEQKWRGRVLKFKCVYDSDNDDTFDEHVYFNDSE